MKKTDPILIKDLGLSSRHILQAKIESFFLIAHPTPESHIIGRNSEADGKTMTGNEKRSGQKGKNSGLFVIGNRSS